MKRSAASGRRGRMCPASVGIASALLAVTACARGGANRSCFGYGTPGGFEPVNCVSTAMRPEELARWVGRPAAALEKDWGPPTRELSDDAFRLLVYEQTETSGRVTGGVRARPTYVRSYLF